MKQKTYILRWNPAISSYRIDDYKRCLEIVKEAESQADEFTLSGWRMNWSIYEYQEARKGDSFYMLCVGDAITPGIYFKGEFLSDPYESHDWAGTDRKRYDVDIACYLGASLEQGPWLTPEELEKAIPDINWRRGHSGELLTTPQTQLLDDLWDDTQDFL